MSSTRTESNTRICIDTRKPGPVINKNIYGQFAEHLGRLLYDGMWVGPDSDIPNTRGWRNDVLAALKELQVPVVRWPGGCFSDEYRWRDGIGPRAQRPVRVNTLWGGVEENNHVGTHEFFDLVEMLGAEAYVNCNMGTGSPREMCEWLEYMTSESNSDLAQLRRKNGRDEPYRVHHFGIGNETWGAGGFMSPGYYCDRYKHWATMARVPWDVPTNFIASGGHGEGDKDITRWTDHLTANIEPNFLLKFDGVSFHYYTHPKGSVWEAKGAATDFPEEEWISTLQATLKMDEYLAANKAILDRNDPDNHVGFYVDEWGTWYDIEEGTNPGFLSQQNSLRDAVVAALNFNIFHNYADRVQMTNIAQMVNVLQAMILTEGDRMILTPTYHAFKMYVPFQGATTLPLEMQDVPQYQLGESAIPSISCTAARGVNGKVYLGLVNTHPRDAKNVELRLPGIEVTGVAGQLLTAEVMDAHNTFEKPEAIAPSTYSAIAEDGKVVMEIPAKAVMVVCVD
jgi:alpha-L-arabinofuranosidase